MEGRGERRGKRKRKRSKEKKRKERTKGYLVEVGVHLVQANVSVLGGGREQILLEGIEVKVANRGSRLHRVHVRETA